MRFKKIYIVNITAFLFVIVSLVDISLLTILFPVVSLSLQLIKYSLFIIPILLISKETRINVFILPLILTACFSLIANEYSSVYNAPARLALWIIMLVSIGPVLFNDNFSLLRNKLLKYFLWGFITISLMSFIYWILGLQNLGRGHFTGVTVHSMILAPIAAISGIYGFSLFFRANVFRMKVFYSFIVLVSFANLLLAASRTALVGFLFASFIVMVFSKYNYKKTVIFMFTLTSIFYISITEYNKASTHNNSLTQNIYERGLENTRQELWNNRIKEFKNYPIFGIGFATEKIVREVSKYNIGQIEPGSTYLMILSMTGSVGFIAFLFLLYKLLINSKFWKLLKSDKVYMLAIFGFFLVHFLAEGYIYAAGSLMSNIFWILLAVVYPYNNVTYGSIINRGA